MVRWPFDVQNMVMTQTCGEDPSFPPARSPRFPARLTTTSAVRFAAAPPGHSPGGPSPLPRSPHLPVVRLSAAWAGEHRPPQLPAAASGDRRETCFRPPPQPRPAARSRPGPGPKKGLDRLIGLVSPFFTKIAGETHHRPRYDRYPALLAVGV